MNKKLVLSVLSTAVVASMASAAMAKPEAGFYVGGEVDKYYSIDAFFDNFDDALNEIIDEIGDTVFVDTNANAAPFVEALNAETTEDLNAILKPATVATFNGNTYANVGDPTKPYDPAKDPDLLPGLPGELKVEGVSVIESTIVEVTFPELAEALTDATVEVKDSKDEVRAVVARDIAKGATKAQFDFVTPIKAEDLTGVWTVDGKAYSFDELKLVADIVAEAGKPTVNQVKLFELLTKAGIQNVDADKIADYADDIANAETTPVWAADVQKIVDQTNKDASEAAGDAAVVKAVADATNQIQLLPVLKANFDRVNAEWIAQYAAEPVDPTGVNKGILALDSTNYAGETDAVTKAQIQAAIDQVNANAIVTADGDADTAAKQVQVTSLIQTWTKDDVAPAKDKENAVKASKAKEAAYRVAEASTENALYNALVAYANATPDATLKASELNASLKTYYFTNQKAGTFKTDLVADIKAEAIATIVTNNGALTNDIKTDVVQQADTDSLADALNDVGAKATAYDSDNTNATKKAAFVKALQTLANYTSHYTTDTSVFLFSTIKDTLVKDYADALKGISSLDAVSDVQAAVKSVNDLEGNNTAVQVIANPASSTTQVRDALVELALAYSNATTDAYVEASSQVKLEVAQYIVDNRSKLAQGTDLTPESITDDGSTSYAANALGKAMADHAAKVAEFNAIDDLSAATTSSTKAALDTYGYAPYKALSAAQKLAVAEEINKLTKPVGNPAVDTPLNFGGDDAVTTLKEANAIIDAAIAAIQ